MSEQFPITEAQALHILHEWQRGRMSIQKANAYLAQSGGTKESLVGVVFPLIRGRLMPDLIDPNTGLKFDYAGLQAASDRAISALTARAEEPAELLEEKYSSKLHKEIDEQKKRVAVLERKAQLLHDELAALRRIVLNIPASK